MKQLNLNARSSPCHMVRVSRSMKNAATRDRNVATRSLQMWQAHVKPPAVLVQRALVSQLPVPTVHSSMPEHVHAVIFVAGVASTREVSRCVGANGVSQSRAKTDSRIECAVEIDSVRRSGKCGKLHRQSTNWCWCSLPMTLSIADLLPQ